MRNRPLTLVPGPSAPPDDADVIQRIREGDSAAFEGLFWDQYDPLVRYAYSFLHTHEESRDIVCDVFSAVWQSRHDWNPAGGIRAYLFGAVRNRCFNLMRDYKRRTELLQQQHHDDLPLPGHIDTTVDDTLEREAQWVAVRRAIENMRGLRREAMRLRWIEQMGHAEIAVVMGISVNAVHLHLSLALKALRAQFGR